MEVEKEPERPSPKVKGQGSPTQGPDFSRAARALRESRETIKKRWEVRTRALVAEASSMSSLVMVNSLNDFLDELAEIFEGPNHAPTRGMTEKHGGQRAARVGYRLPQLLLEFSVLREVLNEVLLEHRLLTLEVRHKIDRSIDTAISLAATEFTRVQKEMVETALAKAEASNRELDRFASIAAHDLKSPLATISGYVELLREEGGIRPGEDSDTYVRVIEKSADQMRSLVDRLLDYAKLAKVERPFERVDLNEVFRSAVQNLEMAVRDTQAKITADSLPVVTGERDLLIQLFQNLIGNSLKFRGSETPEVDVSVQDEGERWLFKVQDNGIGFDPKDKEDIFSLYKRLHGKTEYQGTGIGLATTRRVVELHGGQISADSKPGRGATFFFTLPKS